MTKDESEALEDEAAKKYTTATAIRVEVMTDLDEALPALDFAVKCLKGINVYKLRALKQLSSPPAGVKLTMEAICVMLQVSTLTLRVSFQISLQELRSGYESHPCSIFSRLTFEFYR